MTDLINDASLEDSSDDECHVVVSLFFKGPAHYLFDDDLLNICGGKSAVALNQLDQPLLAELFSIFVDTLHDAIRIGHEQMPGPHRQTRMLVLRVREDSHYRFSDGKSLEASVTEIEGAAWCRITVSHVSAYVIT